MKEEGIPSLHVPQGQPPAPSGCGVPGVLPVSLPPAAHWGRLLWWHRALPHTGLGNAQGAVGTGSCEAGEAVTLLMMGKLREGGQWRWLGCELRHGERCS